MIAITMRMMANRYENGSIEYRDTLAHDWWHFLAKALPGEFIMPIPNIGTSVLGLLPTLPIGLILSGGDDWGVFPERDETEKVLLNWAIQHGVPVLGVCRGAQVLNLLGGGSISSGFRKHHVGTRHIIKYTGSVTNREVNSWHEKGIMETDLAPCFSPVALAKDGSVEAFSGNQGRITGILWHPEREVFPDPFDLHLFENWK